MSHWRKRIGDHLDILLAESLRIAHDTGALKKSIVTAGQGGDHSHSRPDPAKPTW
ncbi:hypothetical protein BMS3Bbin10_02665 [bacterium BMS3Bbin10]|nr:hypothetical protein BMS3Bbin10_02665 [bacterium BMS3Bbin10]